MSVLVLKDIILPEICEREVLRYAGVRGDDRASTALLSECISESAELFAPALCYTELSLKTSGDICDFGVFSVRSKALAKNLGESRRAVLLCATVGLPFDRLLRKYTRLMPSKAFMLSALGTERVEALCDTFSECYAEGNGHILKPRFSTGYGDLPLDVQKDIFNILDPYKNIGVALGGSLLMTPTKSVTAFVGID